MIRSKIAALLERATTMGIFWAWLMLALHLWPGALVPVHAQGTRKDDIVFNSRGVPLAGATVRVCAMPATGQPCSPLANIFADPLLTQALANPTTTDGMGNYFFYAAPGTYEIEVSGPQIATKQIPDVVLPANPASPVFSGTINAFSLNLAGNLSVTGNTTVIGNLASGTLNLSNQSTPPGAASPGTINLYTKTADKRLYYKDETGTETGPLASGGGTPAGQQGAVQIQNGGTLGAGGIIDNGTSLFTLRDSALKGPNPYSDVRIFGAYFGATIPPAINCNLTSASNTMTCAGGVSDFAIGHGVSVPGAGPAPQVSTPSAPIGISTMSISSNVATISVAGSVSYTNASSVIGSAMTDATLNGTYTNAQMTGYGTFTASFAHANCNPCSFGPGTLTITTPGVVTPVDQVGGSTAYNYKAVAVDLNSRALSAASAPFSTTTGAAALGKISYTIATNGCSTSAGQTVITTTAPHSIPNSIVEINITGTGSPFLEGAHVSVASTSTTITINTQSLAAGTYCPSGGTLQVVAKNVFSWLPQPGLTAGHWIYRCVGSIGTTCAANSAYSLIGFATGTDSSFTDWGLGAVTLGPADAAYVPARPPTAPVNGFFATTITNIAGTTVTLANNAGASLTGATVLHDNAESIIAACNSFGTGGADVYSPGQGTVVINSPLDMHKCTALWSRITLAAQLQVNEPIIPKTYSNFAGSPMGSFGASSTFQTRFQTSVQGTAFPLFLMAMGNSGAGLVGVSFDNLNIQTGKPYEYGVFFDQDSLGNNVVVTNFNNVGIGNNAGSAVKLGGGFGLYVNGGAWVEQGASSWGFPPSVLDTINIGLGQNQQQLGGIWEFKDTTFSGGEFKFEAQAAQCGSIPGHMNFTESLLESGFYPEFNIDTSAGCALAGITIANPSYADPLGGQGTPVIEMGNSPVTAMKVTGPGLVAPCAFGTQPLFAAPAAMSAQLENIGCSIIGLANSVSITPTGIFLGNENLNLFGTAQAGSAMTTPNVAPTVAISGSSGPAANTYFYSFVAIDANGKHTFVSPSSTGITVNGAQGVLVTLPSPANGQIASLMCRGNNANSSTHVCSPGFGTGSFVTSTFLDDGTFFPNISANTEFSGAASSAIGPNGASTYNLTITGGGFKDVITGPFTGNHNQQIADANGTVEVSSYINTAFDNANRANGAIGANWSAGQNSVNISGNAFIGGTAAAHNVQSWSANTFSNFGQFSEVTVLTLNGTTDFIGPMVMVTGNTGYTCIENSANIFLQKYNGGTGTNLTSAAITGAPGDVLRLEITEPGGALTCYRNGVVALTASDTTFTSGSPGLDMFDNVATSKNWSGGNLHPLSQLDIEADYTKVQHLNAGVGIGAETFTASPRGEQDVFLPGALTSTWTGSTWTTDKAVTVTRVQVQAKTAPAGCTTNAIVRLTDGTSPVNVTIAAAANDSGSITQNYAAGASLTIGVQTASAGCTTSPADANVVVQYRMQ
jgi:hypothetical protein